MNKAIIIAPHADDEVIGCYQVLKTGRVYSVLYDIDELDVTKISRQHFNFFAQSVEGNLAKYTKTGMDLYKNYCLEFYFPDPYFELHPEHRKWGAVGEELLRKGEDVTFYSTNMNAPYIHEVPDAQEKLNVLNILYPTKKSLWAYDHKYFLFEGYTKWLTNV